MGYVSRLGTKRGIARSLGTLIFILVNTPNHPSKWLYSCLYNKVSVFPHICLLLKYKNICHPDVRTLVSQYYFNVLFPITPEKLCLFFHMSGLILSMGNSVSSVIFNISIKIYIFIFYFTYGFISLFIRFKIVSVDS